MAHALQRTIQYERKLSSLGQRRRDKTAKRKPPDGAGSGPISQGTPGMSMILNYIWIWEVDVTVYLHVEIPMQSKN